MSISSLLTEIRIMGFEKGSRKIVLNNLVVTISSKIGYEI